LSFLAHTVESLGYIIVWRCVHDGTLSHFHTSRLVTDGKTDKKHIA